MNIRYLIGAGLAVLVFAALAASYLAPDIKGRVSVIAPYIGWGGVVLIFLAALMSRRSIT